MLLALVLIDVLCTAIELLLMLMLKMFLLIDVLCTAIEL